MKCLACLVALLPVLLPGNAAAKSFAIQPAASLQQVARAFLVAHAQGDTPAAVTVTPPDPRLRVPRCTRPLQAFLPPGARLTGNLAVGVRCRDKRPWTVFLTASVKVMREVVVATRPLPRGAIVTADDIRLERRDSDALLAGFFTRTTQVVGEVVKRPLAAGSVLADNSVNAPRIVHRGQRVIVLARIAGIEVRSEGKALSGGAEGALVRVRNTSSKRIIEGVVSGPGQVQVRL